MYVCVSCVRARLTDRLSQTDPIREDPMDVSQSCLSIPDISMTEAPPSNDVAESLRAAYSALFKIFYNRTSDLSFETLSGIQILVSVADQYCALPHVAGAIELLLIKWSRSHGKIDEYPIEVLLVATKIRSKVLYNDAFIHLIGQFESYWGHRSKLPEKIRVTVMDEYYLLSEIRKRVDREVAKYAATRHYSKYKVLDNQAMQVPRQLAELWVDAANGEGEGPLYRRINEILKDEEEYEGTMWLNSLGWLTRSKLQLDAEVEYKHLTCANLKRYPWEDADDW
ncbi:hypothetical protein K440DRAFT_78350 [Wilcoxina mikolae CBS 423.85]|nr:hypothetical protein K440DRAFT_78350 [Wilcoxina mikolae CBS 423.85]